MVRININPNDELLPKGSFVVSGLKLNVKQTKKEIRI